MIGKMKKSKSWSFLAVALVITLSVTALTDRSSAESDSIKKKQENDSEHDPYLNQTCIQQLKGRIYKAIRTYAHDHDDRFPKQLADLVPHISKNDLGTLICPADQKRRPAPSRAAFEAKRHSSYRILSGPNVDQDHPWMPVAECEVHGNFVTVEGRARPPRGEEFKLTLTAVDQKMGTPIEAAKYSLEIKEKDQLRRSEVWRLRRAITTYDSKPKTTVKLPKEDFARLTVTVSARGYRSQTVDLAKLEPEHQKSYNIKLPRDRQALAQARQYAQREALRFAYSLKRSVPALQSLLSSPSASVQLTRSTARSQLKATANEATRLGDALVKMEKVLEKMDEDDAKGPAEFVSVVEIIKEDMQRLVDAINEAYDAADANEFREALAQARALVKGLEALVPEVMALARNGDGTAPERSDGGTAPDLTGSPSDSKPSGVFPGKAPPKTQPQQ